MPKSLIFDLHGTLIDSSIGILGSLAFAFAASGISPTSELSPSITGPPLRETLSFLSPDAEASQLDELIASFKDHCDTIGFQQVNLYPGIEHVLTSLAAENIPLHIATNKRHRPTSQIFNSLGWSPLFDLVLSPDSFNPMLPGKPAILSRLLVEANINSEDCLYIGDRLDDHNAAIETGIPFAFADWGFEVDGTDFFGDTIRLKYPDAGQLMSYIIHRACQWPCRG